MKLSASAHRPSPRVTFHRATTALLVTAAVLTLIHRPAHAAIPGDATHSLPPLEAASAPSAGAGASSASAPAWWAAFGEAPLDQLMAQAGAAPGHTARNELVQSYVLMRVQQVRLGLATELLQALQAERDLLRGQSPTREVGQAVAVVDQRLNYAAGLVANFTQLRDAAAGHLVQLAAQDDLVVRDAVRAALSQGGLPEFRAAVPDRLPAAVLLTRDDVASLRGELSALGQGELALNGWIAPASEVTAAPPLERELQARSPDQTLRQAGLEVSWSLRQLTEARAAAVADAQRMGARRLEVMAARQRAELGDVGPTDVLEVYLRFLSDADTAAQSQGVLALAWAALHRQAPGTYALLTSVRR
jgi:hypothetical protein